MSCVIFSVFIATGHELSLSTAFTVLTILNIIKDPLRWVPNLVGIMIEF